MDDLDEFLRKHGVLRAEKEARKRSLLATIASAQAALTAVESDLAAIDKYEALWRHAFGMAPAANEPALYAPSAPNSTPEEGQPKLRARIGEQRYRMFLALELLGPLTMADMIAMTGLGQKRIHDQMSSDMRIGVVEEKNGRFALTDLGMDLKRRYDAYAAQRGKRLPTLEDGPGADEDGDDGGGAVADGPAAHPDKEMAPTAVGEGAMS
jgi:hypothetical protein